jgi:hypothetical protein
MRKMNYHEKFVRVVNEISKKGGKAELKYFFIRKPYVALNVAMWYTEDKVYRVMIEISWFYKYPSTEAIRRRIEILQDEVYYIISGDIVEVIASLTWKELSRDEIDISTPQNVLKLVKEILHLIEDTRKDLEKQIRNIELYESYVEY